MKLLFQYFLCAFLITNSLSLKGFVKSSFDSFLCEMPKDLCDHNVSPHFQLFGCAFYNFFNLDQSMKSNPLREMLNYLLLFLCQFSLLYSIYIPTFLILLSLPHIIFFGFLLSLLDHLSFYFFSRLSILQILNHDVRPNSSFFNIFYQIVTAFQKIFLSFCLEMKHFINDYASLMIILSYWLYTTEHSCSLSPFLPHTWHLFGFSWKRGKDVSLFWTHWAAPCSFRNVRSEKRLRFSKIDAEHKRLTWKVLGLVYYSKIAKLSLRLHIVLQFVSLIVYVKHSALRESRIVIAECELNRHSIIEQLNSHWVFIPLYSYLADIYSIRKCLKNLDSAHHFLV